VADAALHEQLFATVDPDMVRCPYPTYAHLRQEHPVQWLAGLGAFAVTRYDDVMDILKRPEEFSSSRQSGPGAATNLAIRVKDDDTYDDRIRAAAARRAAIAQSAPVLVNADPPRHPRQRRLMNRSFAPKRVAALVPAIQQLTDELVDRFADRGRADLIGDLAMPLPMTVIARALGIEGKELHTLKRWSDAFVAANGNPSLSHEQVNELFTAMNDCYDFFTTQLEDRRRAPREDLLNDIAHARMGDEELTFNEQLQVSVNLMIAGNETTTSLIGSAMLMLMRNPELADRLRADPGLIPPFLEEVLRLEPPVQGLFRIANADTEVAGTPIPRGSYLWLVYASCNRDEQVFADGDELSWDRADTRPHMSFGGGPHFCMGSSLARTEARIAVETLLRRFPDLSLDPSEAGERYYSSLIQHALTRLDVTFTPC
jgi:cytochrome P450